jgi:hypothetical protein
MWQMCPDCGKSAVIMIVAKALWSGLWQKRCDYDCENGAVPYLLQLCRPLIVLHLSYLHFFFID